MQQEFVRASQLHQQGKLVEAENIYRSLLDNDKENPQLNARLASVLVQTKRATQSLSHFSIAIDGLPDEDALIQHAADVAAKLGENVYASKWMGLLLQRHPNNLALAGQYVGVLIANHQEQEALTLVNELIKKQPQNPQFLNVKGMALSRLGEGDKAYKFFEKALRLNSGQIGIVRNLIIHGKGKKQPLLDEIIPQYEQKLRQGGLPADAKMNLAYVVSMHYDKKGDKSMSFEYLKQGNDLNRSGYQYAHTQTQSMFAMLQKAMTPELIEALANKPKIEDGAAPIFILGMPRSGTTLIEQILSSHSKVGAEGELKTLSECFSKHNDRIMQSDSVDEIATALHAAFAEYLGQVRAMQSQRDEPLPVYFTDKMPYNYMMSAFIAAVLPEAKIIHCTRNASETCFSIYKQNFSGNHGYTNDLRELGMYYNLYKQHMELNTSLFPKRIYEANYENMIANSEQEIARLLEYCGLEMETDCLMFHKNKRAVRTASVAQVRQPIYKDAVKASKPFEEQLKPLSEVLESGEGRL
ncbi:hypothetical protein A3762_07480 [Oleiphilus sp. HI0125]|uniref:tetratricopeptide repeat-containing sulfotransferase family protein n=2 Tax=Oleiphilus sp. HI0125 TaxID=1822266 RepID=UPI0007C38ABF|nr:sulfotransferase [Oleiphilus sp. HI0125]KZZ58585.1 hypothetical protein A3762_07480 [Oleiphilus sp. HI0125]